MNDDEPFDYREWGIFLQNDGWSKTAPWKLQTYGRAGALSDAQIVSLGEEFGMDCDLLTKLSRSLGDKLKLQENILRVSISYPTAVRRANEDLDFVKKKMKVVVSRLEEIVARLVTLNADDCDGEPGQHYKRVVHQIYGDLESLKEGRAQITALADTPGTIVKMEPEDKRLLSDHRRDGVLEAVFQTWVDADRKVTFTTDPVTSERSGQLIDFVQAVVACVTDPPTSLSAETITKEIRRSGKSVRPTSECSPEWKEAWNSRGTEDWPPELLEIAMAQKKKYDQDT